MSSWDCTLRLYDVHANNMRLKFQQTDPLLDCCFHVSTKIIAPVMLKVCFIVPFLITLFCTFTSVCVACVFSRFCELLLHRMLYMDGVPVLIILSECLILTQVKVDFLS